MLGFVVLLLASATFGYRTGETFSFEYDSTVATQATQESAMDQELLFDVTCTAIFTVVQADANGAFMRMTLKNVRSAVGTAENMEANEFDDETEAAYAKPTYFTMKNSGAIADITVSTEDDEEVSQMKASIIMSMQTSLSTAGQQTRTEKVIDDQGIHYTHFESKVSGNKVIVQSYYAENDFIEFLDENVQPGDFALDSASEHVIVDQKIVEISSTFQATFSRDAETSNGDESNQEPIFMMTTGTARFSKYAQGNDEIIDLPYTNAADLAGVEGYRRVAHLDRDYYRQRPKREREPEVPMQLDRASNCPGDIDLCKSFDNSWQIGNSNVGLRVSLSAVAGIKKGCQQETRSYMVGAYAGLDILIVGHVISAAYGYAEYGQQYGSPLRNAIELKLFGNSFYKKTFPWLDCIDRSITLASFSKGYSLSYSIIVYVVQIKFSVGISFAFSATLKYTICPQQLKGSVTLIPRGQFTASASASASIAVARAGVTVEGNVADYLDPTVYVDGNTCRVGFVMYNNVEPTNARLYGWWQTRTVKISHWKIKITWGSQHTKTFWQHSWGGTRQKMVDVYYGAK